MAAQLLPGLERKLKADITGDVMFDRFSRGRYATDASHYQMMPLGVVAPRTMAEAERTLALARDEGVSVLPRGGGTSQAGQAVNESLVIDCSLAVSLGEAGRYLRGLGIDKATFSSAYSRRNVRGTNRPSKHSFGLAIDAGQHCDLGMRGVADQVAVLRPREQQHR